jgi:hypothetical protein
MVAFLGLPRSLKGAVNTVFGIEISKDTRDNMKGKAWESMTPDFQKEVSDYALRDAEYCFNLWEKLGDRWPLRERKISAINRRIAQRGIPIDWDALQKNLGIINTALFNAESLIPWIEDYTPLSRKAFNAQCRKQNIEPPKSLAQASPEAAKWFEVNGAECVWAKAVSDYRRINSFKKKLESFQGGTLGDGRYYGGFLYFGASTGRFSGSGGNLNLQNLPRGEMFGVDFRKMIKTPEGRALVVVDLSQIEVRTLCHLAGDTKALQLIKESEDIYHAFGVLLGLHDPANGQLKKYDPVLRHKVKSIVLGCFGAETIVLTNNGWKRIVDVSLTDMVWDGIEWSHHEGVICQGIKTTINQHGVAATADHEILTEHGWKEWSEVLTESSLFQSAIKSGNLPSFVGIEKTEPITLSLNARAGGKDLLIDTTSNLGGLPDAESALLVNQGLPFLKIMGAPLFYQTRENEKDYSEECQPQSHGVILQITETTGTTEQEGYTSTNLGETTAQSIWHISSRSSAGTIRNLNSTVSTTIEDTSPIISDSLLGAKIDLIPDAVLLNDFARVELTYDLKNVGQRNRFTVLTSEGPILVHNCGYGMGVDRFAEFSGLDENEAATAVNLYRKRMKSVVNLWGHYDEGINFSIAAGEEFSVEIASSRVLGYGRIKKMKDSKTGKFTNVGKIMRQGRLMDFRLWGGVITENASQGLARDIFSDMMVRVEEAGYDCIMHVHDELIVEVDEDKAELALKEILAIMSTPPEWIPDIPLSAEGQIMTEYTK